MSWTVNIRTEREGECGPGLWIHDESRRTIVDTGAIDVWPLNPEHKALIEAAPDLLAACRTALERFKTLEDAEEATEADIAARCAVQDAIRRAETGAP